MQKPTELLPGIPKWPLWRVAAIGAGVVVVLLLVLLLRGRGSAGGEGATFTARRGPLDITVLQGGGIQAQESQEVKCEVRVGYQGIKILKIVEEGYEVTEEDIRTNKVLVELDSSDLQKQIVQQDIQYESAAASLTDAQQNYEIQLNQNLSDIKAAEQKVRFARMDFDKFLGDQVTQAIIDQLGLEKAAAAEETNADARVAAVVASVPTQSEPRPQTDRPPGGVVIKRLEMTGGDSVPTNLPPPLTTAAVSVSRPLASSNAPAKPSSIEPQGSPQTGAAAGAGASKRLEIALGDAVPTADPRQITAPSVSATAAPPALTNDLPKAEAAPALPAVVIDFSKYADIDVLGDGEAKQKLRKFEDDLQVSKKEQGQAQSTLEGTKRLFEKGFVTKIDLDRDTLAAENARLKVQTAETARDLFLKYEFSRTAEEFLSKYGEAVRELVRARKAAVSKLAQAQAKLKSAQGQYNIQARQRKEFYDQLAKCVITAKKPGLVVYGGARDDMVYYGGEERIREGATVRERQAIITIPDMTKMEVRVKIHESYIKKVKKGQKARITVDAFPDKVLSGEVTKVGVLPDSQDRWMNPDMKVYLTTITIDSTQDWIKPGMSAKVEIIVNRLSDVVYAPVQAVSPSEGKQVCYIANGGKPERRVVDIGEFNDEFIEIKNGLKEGERVLLRAVASQAPEKTGEKAEPQPKEKPAPQPVAAPASAPGAPAART